MNIHESARTCGIRVPVANIQNRVTCSINSNDVTFLTWQISPVGQVIYIRTIGTTSGAKVSQGVQASCNHLIVLKTQKGKSYADYSPVDFEETVMELTGGRGVKFIVDGVGKSTADISVQCLDRRGLWISFGNTSGAVPPFRLLELTPKSGYVTRSKLGAWRL